eukprot:gene152-137_t
MAPKKVVLVGSGNWGSAVALIVGQNVERYPDDFGSQLTMFAREEPCEHEGQTITVHDCINKFNVNSKYLGGFPLPKSVVAEPDLAKATAGANILIWCIPHQFVASTLLTVKASCAPDCISISLIKGGIDIKDGEIELCSDLIRQSLNHDCSVLMGANVANEVAAGDFCEATIGYREKTNALVLQKLFNAPTFSIDIMEDVPGVELCGALKNIVALGAGFVDGVGMGGNTKAAVMRIGLQEMSRFISKFYKESKPETMFQSCGVA